MTIEKQIFTLITADDEAGAIDLVPQITQPNMVNEQGVSLLAMAAGKKCNNLVTELLRKGANVNFKFLNEEYTAINMAIAAGNPEGVGLLVQDPGFDPTHKSQGLTYLNQALGDNVRNHEIIEHLLNAGVDKASPLPAEVEGEPPVVVMQQVLTFISNELQQFMNGLKNGIPQELEEFTIAQGQNNVDSVVIKKFLMQQAGSNYQNLHTILELLVQHGSPMGDTALNFALRSKLDNAVGILLSHPQITEYINVVDPQYGTSLLLNLITHLEGENLDAALQVLIPKIENFAEFVAPRYDGVIPLVAIAAAGVILPMQILHEKWPEELAANANVCASNTNTMHDGVTPLIAAAQKGHLANMLFLLDHGADIDYTTLEHPMTALAEASARGHTHIV